jgi:hypothetical protein
MSVQQLSDQNAAEIAKAGYETGQIGLLQYNLPSISMPNAGLYVYGKTGDQETKYLIAYRNKWIGWDLTAEGQSQTELGVYADALGAAVADIGKDTFNLVGLVAIAAAAFFAYKFIKEIK